VTGVARTRFALAARSLAAAAWFASWFFGVFPAAILWVSGRGVWPAFGWRQAVSLAVIALAHLVLLPQVVAFVRHGEGTHAPFDPPRRLVTRALYLRVRNPMYLTYVAIIAAEALFFESLALLAYAGAFWLLAHAFVVKLEEPGLDKRFGPAWRDYRSRVPRWLPRLRGGPPSLASGSLRAPSALAQSEDSERRTLPLDVRGSSDTNRNSRGTL
jgi:protein-S-isoprenylcysteine O-methyltransferase Ste14